MYMQRIRYLVVIIHILLSTQLLHKEIKLLRLIGRNSYERHTTV